MVSIFPLSNMRHVVQGDLVPATRTDHRSNLFWNTLTVVLSKAEKPTHTFPEVVSLICFFFFFLFSGNSTFWWFFCTDNNFMFSIYKVEMLLVLDFYKRYVWLLNTEFYNFMHSSANVIFPSRLGQLNTPTVSLQGGKTPTNEWLSWLGL